MYFCFQQSRVEKLRIKSQRFFASAHRFGKLAAPREFSCIFPDLLRPSVCGPTGLCLTGLAPAQYGERQDKGRKKYLDAFHDVFGPENRAKFATMRIGILSDTHSYLDDRILHHLEGCAEIWHAGDIGSFEVLDGLSAVAPVRAVYGNIDDHRMRSTCPERLVWDCAGLRCAMVHIGGHPGRYAAGIGAWLEAERPDIFLCGHSHILRVERDARWGGLFINPGAAGTHGFHRMRTLLRMEVVEGEIRGMEAVELGLRGKIS